MNKVLIVSALFIMYGLHGNAQSEKKLIREGNKFYKEGAFEKAEISYQKASDKNPLNDKALFNLGSARFQQNNFTDATNQFSKVAEMSKSADVESKANYNAANSLMSQKKFAESIPLYKKALKLNPNDDDARYNLAYAMQMLKKQQEQEKNKDNEKNKNKDDQKDQEKQDKEKQDKEQQKDQNNQQKEQGEQQKDQKQQQQLSKEDAERMLQALTGEEKKTMEKLNEQKVKSAKRIAREKDW